MNIRITSKILKSDIRNPFDWVTYVGKRRCSIEKFKGIDKHWKVRKGAEAHWKYWKWLTSMNFIKFSIWNFSMLVNAIRFPMLIHLLDAEDLQFLAQNHSNLCINHLFYLSVHVCFASILKGFRDKMKPISLYQPRSLCGNSVSKKDKKAIILKNP